jgi:hypothetical protein
MFTQQNVSLKEMFIEGHFLNKNLQLKNYALHFLESFEIIE